MMPIVGYGAGRRPLSSGSRLHRPLSDHFAPCRATDPTGRLNPTSQVSPEQRRLVQQLSSVSMSSSCAPPTAIAGQSAEGGGPGDLGVSSRRSSGSGSGSRSAAPQAADPEQEPLVCGIVPDSWTWLALPVVAHGGPSSSSFPVFSFEAVVTSGRGTGLITLRVGAQGGGHAPQPHAGPFSGSGERFPVVAGSSGPLDLGAIEVPVSIAQLPMKMDGYQVRCPSSNHVC